MTRQLVIGRLGLHVVTRRELPRWTAQVTRDAWALYVWIELHTLRLCAIYRSKR